MLDQRADSRLCRIVRGLGRDKRCTQLEDALAQGHHLGQLFLTALYLFARDTQQRRLCRKRVVAHARLERVVNGEVRGLRTATYDLHFGVEQRSLGLIGGASPLKGGVGRGKGARC